MERQSCGGCGAAQSAIELFLNLGQTPLANDLPRTIDQPEELYPLRLGVCTTCWLVQMMDVVPHERVFGGDYTFYSGTSPALVNYHESYARTLCQRHMQIPGLVVEIACNDGDLLRHFATAGHKTLGIDPAEGPVRQARQRGLDVIHDSFTHESADRIRRDFGGAKLIIANNVLAHVIDLGDFMRGVQTLLVADGVAVIEVQYLPDLLLGNQLDHVYHEHRYFFSLSSLMHVAEMYGLTVAHAEITPQQGGSLRVTLAHVASGVALTANLIAVDRVMIAEKFVRHESTYHGVQFRAERVRDRLRDMLTAERHKNRVVAGYGMPAKGTTLLNFCEITSHEVSHIVDTTPAKMGRYAPGVKIPIVGPNMRNDPDTYLVLVWNYLAGILAREDKFRASGGKLIVPIPAPVML